jgi:hypothetical protein
MHKSVLNIVETHLKSRYRHFLHRNPIGNRRTAAALRYSKALRAVIKTEAIIESAAGAELKVFGGEFFREVPEFTGKGIVLKVM